MLKLTIIIILLVASLGYLIEAQKYYFNSMRDGVGYIGQGKNGKKHGRGVEYYKNGDRYR